MQEGSAVYLLVTMFLTLHSGLLGLITWQVMCAGAAKAGWLAVGGLVLDELDISCWQEYGGRHGCA